MALFRRRQLITICLVLVFLHLWLGRPFLQASKPKYDEAYMRQKYPLASEHVWKNTKSGKGGGMHALAPFALLGGVLDHLPPQLCGAFNGLHG